MTCYKKIILILLLACLCSCGNKREIYHNCQGSGTPAVIFISGRGDRSDIWEGVLPEVAKFTRACAYDRPGTVTIIGQTVQKSRSTPARQPTTPLEGVSDLQAILANIPPPYVLVAHSYGGLIARLYAARYPQNVSGLVLVDTLTEFLYDDLDPEEQALWLRLNSNYSKELDAYFQEKTDLEESFRQMRGIAWKPVPTIILVSDQPYDFAALIRQGILPADAPIDFGNVVFKAHLKGQEQLAKLYNGKLVRNTQSGHYIQTENPQAVIDAIQTFFIKA